MVPSLALTEGLKALFQRYRVCPIGLALRNDLKNGFKLWSKMCEIVQTFFANYQV